jgi:hypothetical protein
MVWLTRYGLPKDQTCAQSMTNSKGGNSERCHSNTSASATEKTGGNEGHLADMKRIGQR